MKIRKSAALKYKEILINFPMFFKDLYIKCVRISFGVVIETF